MASVTKKKRPGITAEATPVVTGNVQTDVDGELTLATLFKRTAGGKVQMWHIQTQANPDGTASNIVTFGLVDGKQQVQEEVIKVGKNIGKKSETTPLQQAENEAIAKWFKQRDRQHYSEDATGGESAEKRAAAPMLAHKYPDHMDSVDWNDAKAQPKLNGHRCLARYVDGKVSLISRKNTEIVTLPHIQEAVARMVERFDFVSGGGENTLTLDGELYVDGTAVTKIGGYVKKQQPGSEKVRLHIYDVIADKPYRTRLGMLDLLFAGQASVGPLSLVETVGVLDHCGLMGYRDKCLKRGYEGAMLRWGPAGYEAGKRSQSLLKVKVFLDQEFEVVGVKEGTGTHAGMAVFRCVTEAGHSFDVTAPGTHAEKRTYLANAADYIGKMLTVQFSEWTDTDKPVPFHVVALQFREDI